jgi:RNA polymerase sigma-70 factor (ECF subfamily)
MSETPVRSPLTTNLAQEADFDDQLLVDRIAEGDEAAFERLFHTHFRRLCEFAFLFTRSAATAEEIVQAVMLRVWERRRTWEPRGGVRAYLYAACRNAALDLIRHEELVRDVEVAVRARDEAMPGLGSQPRPPDALVAEHELRDAIGQALSSLPERRRTVVLLRWQHGMGPSEIARVLGITVKGVESNIARALADIRERLEKYRP